MSKSTLDWNKINKTVIKTVEFLKPVYPTQIQNFNSWYNRLDKKKINKITDPKLKQWVIQGIPQMKVIIILMNREIDGILKRLCQMKLLDPSLVKSTQTGRIYMEGIETISETIVEFLGCRNQVGEWYIKLLKEYSDNAQVRNEYQYFEYACQTNQIFLLDPSLASQLMSSKIKEISCIKN